MTPHENESVEARVARLERLVEELQRQLAARPASAESPLAASPSTTIVSPALPVGRTLPPPRPGRITLPRIEWDGQMWLNRLGIGMVLLGVGLLFRYSIEMGWLTPAVRVLFGAVTGAVLFAAGLRLNASRRFGEVLLGGGMATWYITGWAAFNLYGLVGYVAAFAGMLAITALAFGMALRLRAPALAILGAAGGLGTPLLLGVSYGTPRGFAIYTCVILAGVAAVVFRRRWRWLLWTAMPLGWLLLYVYARHQPGGPDIALADKLVVQAAALFAWTVLGVVPLGQRVAERMRVGHERHWPHAEVAHWYALALVPPAAALAVAAAVWHPQPVAWGWWTLGVTALYALAGWALYRPDHRIARAVLFTASVLLSAGCVAAFGGDALLASLAAQALALHWLAGRGGGPSLRWMAHKVFIAAAAWMLFRLVENGDTDAPRVLADLSVVAAALLGSFLLRTRRTVLWYRYFAHVAWMGWLWRELAQFEGGQGFATIAWGAYGLGLMLLALRRRSTHLEKLSIATLLAVVAKLFLVDLSALHPLFRVVLFLGFGSVFLFLSYALQGWWSRVREHAADAAAP